LNYNRARYLSFADAPCYGGETPAEGCRIVAGRPIQDLGGHDTALAPRWTAALEANYQHEVAENLVFGANLNVKYSSSYFGNAFGNPRSKPDSYATLDGAVRLRT